MSVKRLVAYSVGIVSVVIGFLFNRWRSASALADKYKAESEATKKTSKGANDATKSVNSMSDDAVASELRDKWSNDR